MLSYFQTSNLASNLGDGGSFFAGIPATEAPHPQEGPSSKDEQPTSSTQPAPEHRDDLELDDLNQHPSMATILKLIDINQEKFPQTDPHNMPQWMAHIHSKFTSQRKVFF